MNTLGGSVIPILVITVSYNNYFYFYLEQLLHLWYILQNVHFVLISSAFRSKLSLLQSSHLPKSFYVQVLVYFQVQKNFKC